VTRPPSARATPVSSALSQHSPPRHTHAAHAPLAAHAAQHARGVGAWGASPPRGAEEGMSRPHRKPSSAHVPLGRGRGDAAGGGRAAPAAPWAWWLNGLPAQA
jgi:hypothetical protein